MHVHNFFVEVEALGFKNSKDRYGDDVCGVLQESQSKNLKEMAEQGRIYILLV